MLNIENLRHSRPAAGFFYALIPIPFLKVNRMSSLLYTVA